ncbi:MAG: hypothetical protein WD069_19930 [Planctomycetales bacterium]
MQPPPIPLPKFWPATVCSAVLHVIALARFVAIHTRSWAANSANERVRQRAEIDRLQSEVLMLREEPRFLPT